MFLCLNVAYNNSNNKALKLLADFLWGKYSCRMPLLFFKVKTVGLIIASVTLNVESKYKVFPVALGFLSSVVGSVNV